MNEQNQSDASASPTRPADSSADKEAVKKKFRTIFRALTRASMRLNDEVKTKNRLLDGVKTELCNVLDKKFDDALAKMNEAINEMPWDRLGIAFFGETTAGKSTLVEMFRTLFERNRPRGNDGLIIGDMSPDFTQKNTEYEMEIDGRPFVLVDAPGTEGDVKKFRPEIEKSLRKVHCVFYVKKGKGVFESTVAENIGTYLRDCADVYSIQNVPGFDYEGEDDRKTLLSDAVREDGRLIGEGLRKILNPDAYKGNIPVQGLIALCAHAEFASERQDLKKNQCYFRERFGNADAMWKFSNAQELVDLVRELAKPENFTAEINAANERRLKSLVREVRADIEKFLKEKEKRLETARDALWDYRKKIEENIITEKERAKETLIRRSVEVVCERFPNFGGHILRVVFEEGDTQKRSVEAGSTFAKTLKAALAKEYDEAVRECCERIRQEGENLLESGSAVNQVEDDLLTHAIRPDQVAWEKFWADYRGTASVRRTPCDYFVDGALTCAAAAVRASARFIGKFALDGFLKECNVSEGNLSSIVGDRSCPSSEHWRVERGFKQGLRKKIEEAADASLASLKPDKLAANLCAVADAELRNSDKMKKIILCMSDELAAGM